MRKANKWRVGALTMMVVATTLAFSAQASVRSQVLYARGLVPFHRGFWEQAYRLFDQAVDSDPNDALALYYRGLTQARRGSHREAIADLQRSIELAPMLTHAELDLGIAYLDAGDHENARIWLTRAHRHNIDKLNSAFFLGLSLLRGGHPTNSLRYFEEAKADPELRQAAFYYGGLALLQLGSTEQARLAFAEAAREQPESEIGRAATRYVSGEEPVEVETAAESRPPRYWLGARVGFEYDSNVTLGSDDAIGNTGSEADGRTVIAVDGGASLVRSDWGELSASAALSQSLHFSASDFDLTATSLRLDWTGAPDWWTYGASVGYDYNALDFDSFFQDVVMNPWVAFYETDATATQLHYGFRYRDFLQEPYDPFRDGFNHAFGVRQYFLLPDDVSIVHGGYQLDVESPEDTGDDDPFLAQGAKDFEYIGHQIDLQASSTLEISSLGSFDGSAGYRFRYDDYSNDNSRSRATNPGDPEKRRDYENLVAFSVGRDLNQDVGFLAQWTRRSQLSVYFIGDFNGSNIDVFDYTRVIGGVGLRTEF